MAMAAEWRELSEGVVACDGVGEGGGHQRRRASYAKIGFSRQ